MKTSPMGYYNNSYIRVFSSTSVTVQYVNMVLDVVGKFGLDAIPVASKHKLHKLNTVYNLLRDSVTIGVMDYIKSNHPNILIERCYDVYCTSVFADLVYPNVWDRYHIIDDRGTDIVGGLCAFVSPNDLVEFNKMKQYLNERSTRVQKPTPKRFDKLVTSINGVISERLSDQISDYSTEQERIALINLASIKIATSLMDRINTIDCSLVDPKQTNIQLVEFINGFNLDASKKD